MKRLAVLVAVLVTLGVTSHAAAAQRGQAATVRGGGPAISWSRCPEAPEDDPVQCATLSLPVDWTNPHGPRFDLALSRRPALEPGRRIGSLLFNPGGPGGPGREFVIFAASFFSDEIRRHFDLIGFDPRGVGLSHPVQCSAELLYAPQPYLLTSQADYDQVKAHSRQVYQDCRARTGPLFDHLDMLSVVDDMDAIRAALGDRRLNFFGISYGTLNAQQYAERYPDRVRAIVADSIMDHSLDTAGFVLTEAASAQDSFDEFAAWCTRTPECPLHGRDVPVVFADLYARAGRGEIPVAGQERALRPDELISFAFNTFYGPDWWGLAQQLAAVEAGEPFVIAGPPPQEPPSEQGTAVAEPGVVADPTLGIFCSDWSFPIRDYGQYAKIFRHSERIAPDMRYSPPAGFLPVACLGWPEPILNPQHRVRVHGLAAPMLLLNSRHDPATGYNWAVNVARQLGDQAVLLTYDGWGHVVSAHSGCGHDAVDSYLVTLRLPARGARCPAEDFTAAAQQRYRPTQRERLVAGPYAPQGNPGRGDVRQQRSCPDRAMLTDCF